MSTFSRQLLSVLLLSGPLGAEPAAEISGYTLVRESAPALWHGWQDAGWGRFPGGPQVGWHSVEGLPMVFSATENGAFYQMLALLPGRAYLDATLEMTASSRLLWGDNLLWGGGGDLFYNGDRVQLAGRRVGVGTETPEVELEVRGDARVVGTLEVLGTLRLMPAGGVPMGRFTKGVPPGSAGVCATNGEGRGK